MDYGCPKDIADLFEKDTKAGYKKHLDYIKSKILPKLKDGDRVETPDGNWLKFRQGAGLS